MEAAEPFVDVLSFQDFRDPLAHLDEWHRSTGKPVLLADAARVGPAGEDGFVPNNGAWYAQVLEGLLRNPGCVGFHLCGAYQRNKARRRGLLDEMETPDQPNIDLIRAANQEAARWVAERSRNP